MPRLIPVAVALSMLAPFAVWGALRLSGMRGSYGFDHPEQLAMPAVLFWTALLLVPVAFAATLGLAARATRTA